MRRRNQRAVLVVLAVVLTGGACSSAPPPRRNSVTQQRLITAQEIGAIQYSSAFEVVEALRPQWLRLRGRTSVNMREYVKVYLDDSLLGDPEQLRNVMARSIGSIRFLDANEASARWGLDHGQGAIVVSTRRDSTTRR
jgi:hypothetical protein